ncbi:hypothetical protein PIROE2DRAFT_62488 [Piromyces sp. E2]|nr:hypothetical protein PIROE2DRAFT_62488 [Piromyces sp. E2]|eukprot:OUM61481.1 hypothetical protein PIROE2DRAFT_62488 [Piromyces sp. E2]
MSDKQQKRIKHNLSCPELTVLTLNFDNNEESNEKTSENNEKIDEVSKLYKKVNILEKIANGVFYINLIVSAITIIEFKFQDLFFIINIIFSITYVVITNLVDIYFKNIAENERRKSFIKESFNVNITKRITYKYYNNEEQESVRKMGINCFENLFFTKYIAKKMLVTESIKVFVIILLYIILLIQVKDLELLVLITQTVFSSEYLFKYIKFVYFKIQVTRIYLKMYDMFITNPGQNEKVMMVKILDATMDYECLKFYCKISLSPRIYKKYVSKLNKEWDDLYHNYIFYASN